MNEYERKQLDDFFSAIEPNLPGYKHATFSYVALKKGKVFELVQGRLTLPGISANVASKNFESESLRAEFCKLEELMLTPRQVIENLFSGGLKTPLGELHFPPEDGRDHSV